MLLRKRRGASSADLISGLCDDVLLRILELLPDAADAVRTGSLSRRWRGLWTRLSSLTFDSSSSRRRKFLESDSSHKRFVVFVNKALAQRAMAGDAAADLERLAISLAIMSPPALGEQETDRLVRRSAEAAQGWIRHAAQSTARSFVLKLWMLMNWYRGRSGNVIEQSVINLNDLPSPAKLESMQLDLGLAGLRLHLPATAVFTSLVDLSLEDIELVAGSGHLLARLVSSACCPSLQKLQLRKLRLPQLNKLLIKAGALLELSIASVPIESPQILKLKTPSLRILHIEDYAILKTLGISAPKLEELTFLPDQLYRIKVGGELPSVESLKVELTSHGYEDDDLNYGGICLLRSCTSLTCLEVSLEVTPEEDRFTDMISGRIPHLPHIISLTVHSYLSDLHSFGVGLAEILKQCSHLKYLHVHCIYMDGHNHYLCNHPNQWKPHQIYLANIQEVRFTRLAGTDCESSFIQGVLAHATQLQKVALSLAPRFRPHNMIDRSTFIPWGGGTWVCQDPPLSYEWKSDPIHK